jgi:hypothetical protein
MRVWQRSRRRIAAIHFVPLNVESAGNDLIARAMRAEQIAAAGKPARRRRRGGRMSGMAPRGRSHGLRPGNGCPGNGAARFACAWRGEGRRHPASTLHLSRDGGAAFIPSRFSIGGSLQRFRHGEDRLPPGSVGPLSRIGACADRVTAGSWGAGIARHPAPGRVDFRFAATSPGPTFASHSSGRAGRRVDFLE